MERRVPDTSKAKQAFGFAPTHSLSDIVISVVEYYREKSAASTLAEPVGPPLTVAGNPLASAQLASIGA